MPDLPPDILTEASSLLDALLTAAESVYGPRDAGFDIVGIDQHDDGPRIIVDNYAVTVTVGPNAVGYAPTLLANLAHETIHLLNPVADHASQLEEGAAVHFELQQVAFRHGASESSNHRNILLPTYAAALEDFEALLSCNASAPRTIRDQFGSLSGLTVDQICSVVPDLEQGVLVRLARKCRPR